MKSRKYPERPIIGVGVCVFNKDNILLIQRANPPRAGCWSLPGGVQRLGETLEECAKREIKEETGLDISVSRLIDVLDSIHYDGSGKILYQYTLVDYVGHVLTGKPVPAGDALAVRWCSKPDAVKLVSWSETKRIIDLAFKIKRDY